jgi:hypothetical protein
MSWLSVIWILNHLLLAVLISLGTHKRFFGILLVGILQLILILSKPISYDLNQYIDYFSDPNYSFEIGFSVFSILINYVTNGNAYFSLWFFQNIGVLSFAYLLGKLFKNTLKINITVKEYIYLIVAFYLTLFYFMGSQNVLRQYIAIILVGFGFLFQYQGKILLAAVFIVISVLFHLGTIIFVAFSLASLFLRKFSYVLSLPIFFAGGAIMAFGFNEFYPETEYLTIGFAAGDERTVASLKASVYFLILILSFLIISRSIQSKEFLVSFIVKLRFYIFFFSLPLVFLSLDEFYSRIIFPLFFMDAILICRSFISGTTKQYNFSSAMLIFSYAFAPNALNLLGG